MKFKTLFLLTSVISSSVLLTACNEKETTTPKQSEQVKQETVHPQNVNDNPLTKFNESVRIITKERNILKDDKGNEAIAISYEVENLSDKGISGIHWASVYDLDGKTIYSVNLPIVFEKPIAPKTKEIITETTAISVIPEENRAIALDPKSNISVIIGAFELDFVDGSKIVVKQ